MPLGRRLLTCRNFCIYRPPTVHRQTQHHLSTTAQTVLARLTLTPLARKRSLSLDKYTLWLNYKKNNRLSGCFLQSLSLSSSSSALASTMTTSASWLMDSSSLTIMGYTCLALYVAIECAFYFYFHYIIVPRANQRTASSPYLDYPEITDRHKLLERILTRLEFEAVRESVPISHVLSEFFIQWFAEYTEGTISTTNTTTNSSGRNFPPGLVRSQSSRSSASGTSVTVASTTSTTDDASSISSAEGEEEQDVEVVHVSTSKKSSWSIPGLGYTEVCEFLAWAFFAKDHDDLTEDERTELGTCLDILRIRTGLIFPVLKSSPYKPRRLSLEDVSPLHRPLLVYLAIELMRFGACLLLRLNGFTPTKSNGVMGWYRPGQSRPTQSTNQPPQLPLVFFHGIAPAGFAFYLPMIYALISDGRPALVVEQVSISGRLGTFGTVDETEMMQAVERMIEETIDAADSTARNLPLLWVGHSFGSCPISWMLRHASLKNRTGGVHLLDPVTILLSQPDVMNNFLYNQEISKIRMVAASELFTEYYLRRHFAWYNAELWVDDVDFPITVALSECDEIVNSPKVASYLSQYPQRVRTIYWPGARHAHCVSSPSKWGQLQQSLWQQEAAFWEKQ